MKNSQLSTLNSQLGSRGATLVELLVYMAILTVVMTFVTDFLLQTIETRLEIQAKSSLEQDQRFILSRLVYDIKRADSITTPVRGTTNNLVLVIGGETHNFQLSTVNFQLTNGSGTYNLNSSDIEVSDLSFQRLEDTVKITMTLTPKKGRPGGEPPRTITTTVGLR
jgi:Tfp pilus assembly protein PilW